MTTDCSIPAKTPYQKRLHFYLFLTIAISVIVRAFLAWTLEFSNDEVYYWLYALYPDWSHFDHPPMVGWLIQLTTLNLRYDSEFFIRLGAVILGAINTWLIYLVGKQIRDEITGLYAAILYNASLYCFIVAGTFIMPDTPQLFFWISATLLMLQILPEKEPTPSHRRKMLLLGLVIGLGMLSKYTSAFLWVAAGSYILLYNRKWLKTTEFYLSALITLVIFLPVIYWNYQHHFISFTYHGERVDILEKGLRPEFFLRELAGQIFYNNPVNFALFMVAMIAAIKKRLHLPPDYRNLLLLLALPLPLLFLLISLFRATLPHWSGPGYLAMIILGAAFLGHYQSGNKWLLPLWIRISILFGMAVLILGYTEIKTGFLASDQSADPKRLGRHDVTLDMSGWRQFSEEFRKLRQEDIASGIMNEKSPIIIHRWFPGAHIDYYVARPLRMNVIGIGELKNLHKYAWIRRYRPGLYPMANAYFITDSRNFTDPNNLYSNYFTSIEPPVIIPGYKQKKHVRNFFIYRLKGCHTEPPDILGAFGL